MDEDTEATLYSLIDEIGGVKTALQIIAEELAVLSLCAVGHYQGNLGAMGKDIGAVRKLTRKRMGVYDT